MIDAGTALLYVAPFGLALAAATSTRRIRPASGRPGPTPRQLRRLVKQSARQPQPEVKQRPGWGPESKLPPDGLTLED